MIQRLLVAVIAGFLVLTSQIASAADIDWNSAPKIGSKAEFARYIENERRKGYTTFNIVLINGLKVDTIDDFADIALAPYVDIKGTWQGIENERIAQMTYKITEYPGTRVANAYLSRNQYESWLELTNEEKQLYNIAVGIVDEANKRQSEVEKARYIHDVICDRVKDYKNENERNKTAIGALIDGYAHCQGYTDAFYMLGRMSGLEISRIGGRINKNNGLHGWNTITFRDGRTYFVDVTNDHINNTNVFFCAGRETIQQHFTCDWSIIPNLQWKNYE